jgi:hypothetical protein
VNALPAAWLQPPQTGELSDSIADCDRRLRGYALAEGFDIVHTGDSVTFHGEETRNWSHLEDRVERDREGTIISKRQREGTLVSQVPGVFLGNHKAVLQLH